MGKKRSNYSDMREAARRATAEHQTDGRPAASRFYRRGRDVIGRQMILDLRSPE
jgi:hypothetical protein